MISQDNPIPASAVAAVAIHFLPFCAFLFSEPEKNIRDPQYNIYTSATNDSNHNIQLTEIWIMASTYDKDVS